MKHIPSLDDLQSVVPDFIDGMVKVGAATVASAAAFFVSDATPSEFAGVKDASYYTGWGLALVVIGTLAKVVKHLYTKLEERDAKIIQLYADAAKEAKTESDEAQVKYQQSTKP
jgi:hypothetical protein